MYWNNREVMTLKKKVCTNIWAATIMVVFTSLTSADTAPERIQYNYQDVQQLDVKIMQPGDAASEEPNEVLPVIEHPALRILGEMMVLGRPVPGVLIKTDPGAVSCVTDKNGQFEVAVPYGWSGKITPIKEGWVFDPLYREYDRVRCDIDMRLDHDSNLAEDMPEAPSLDEVSHGAPPAWGHIGVTPMVISFNAQPGETLNASLAVQNMGIQSPNVTMAPADLQQDPSGNWKPVAPSLSNPHSCSAWLILNQGSDTTLSIPAMDTITCPLEMRVPDDARGFYSAALLVRPQETSGQTNAFNCTLVVPVLVHVQSDKIMTDVRITDIELLVPFTLGETKQPRIRLTIKNQGATMSMFNASVIASDPEHAMLFGKGWIMPGTSLSLETDYVGPHPTESLSLHGYLEMIELQSFVKHMPWTPDEVNAIEACASNTRNTEFTTDPAQTLAMLDYNTATDLHLEQCHDAAADPFSTYSGQYQMGMAVNFPATVQAEIQGCSDALGNWTATAQPSNLKQPSHVLLRVKGNHVAVNKLFQADNVLVAKLVVYLIPEIGAWRPPCLER